MSMAEMIKNRGAQRFPDMDKMMVSALTKLIASVPELRGVQVSTVRNTDLPTNLVVEYITGESIDFVRYDTAILTLYTTDGYKYANDITVHLTGEITRILDYSSMISVIEVVGSSRDPQPNEDTHIRTIELDIIAKAY